MRFVSLKTFFEVFAGIWLNLTSGWFGILLISPGLFGTASPEAYLQLLTINAPFGIGYSGITDNAVVVRKK